MFLQKLNHTANEYGDKDEIRWRYSESVTKHSMA